MANSTQEVYRCPSCGTIGAVSAGDRGERVCAECGFAFAQPVPVTPRPVAKASASSGSYVQRDLSVRRRQNQPNRVEAVVPRDALGTGAEADESPETKEREEIVSDNGHKRVVRRTRKRRRTRLTPLIFLCGWAVVVMLVIILVRGRAENRAGAAQPGEVEVQKRRAKQRAMAAFLAENHVQCWNVLHEYLAASSTAERAQFVRDAGRLVSVMDEHYMGTLPWTVPEDHRLAIESMNLFLAGDRRAIELVVGVKVRADSEEEGSEGSEEATPDGSAEEIPDREIAFVRQGGRWLIDWEGLVRYSTARWPLFVKNAGEREGVFRVYMRMYPGAAPSDDPAVRIQFLPPREDEVMWKQDSPWVTVSLESRDGRRIESIMAAAEAERELGDSIFGAGDPPGLYRVRVVLGWEEVADGTSRLVLREVQAGNWYGLGFEEDFGEEAVSAEDAVEEESDASNEEEPEPPEPEER